MKTLRAYRRVRFHSSLEIWMSRLFLIFLAVNILLIVVTGIHKTKNYDFALYGVFAVWFVCLLTATWANISRQIITNKLPRISDDLALIGRLVEATETNPAKALPFQSAARFQLLRLLPQLEQRHGIHLSAAHRQQLYRVLKSSDAEFIVVILRAFEKVGDSAALPHVQQLALASCDTDAAVLSAARQCLLILEVRSMEENNQQTLLRGSTPVPSSNLLLRPTLGIAQVTSKETTQLLRPAVGQDDTPHF